MREWVDTEWAQGEAELWHWLTDGSGGPRWVLELAQSSQMSQLMPTCQAFMCTHPCSSLIGCGIPGNGCELRQGFSATSDVTECISRWTAWEVLSTILRPQTTAEGSRWCLMMSARAVQLVSVSVGAAFIKSTYHRSKHYRERNCICAELVQIFFVIL